MERIASRDAPQWCARRRIVSNSHWLTLILLVVLRLCDAHCVLHGCESNRTTAALVFQSRCLSVSLLLQCFVARASRPIRAAIRHQPLTLSGAFAPILLNSRTESRIRRPIFEPCRSASRRNSCWASQPGCPNVVALGKNKTPERRGTPMSATSYPTSLPNVEHNLSAPPLCCCCRSPPAPSLAQGLQPGEAFATRFSGTAPGADGSPAIDIERHGRQHSRSARTRPAAAGSALDQRAAAQSDHRRRDRPGVRRRVRRCHSAEHLRHRHRRVRPAPYRRQRAMDARHVRLRRSRRDLQARRVNGYKPMLFADRHAERPARTPAPRSATSPTTAGTSRSWSPTSRPA